jgi:uncharacterized protein (TIGR00290 family)
MKKKVSMSWSGGKDSAFALYKILTGGDYEVVSLHTVFNAESKRVGMHGVHENLIEEQAQSLKLPLEKLYLESSENHDAYTELLKKYYRHSKSHGIDRIVFGDIFLQDLKDFRDKLISHAGLEAIYPLWKIDSEVLIQDFINLGFKTMICSANGKYFAKSILGATIDLSVIKNLPEEVDPCGENGEFHTFVYDGPIFHQPIQVRLGETIERNYEFQVINESGGKENKKMPFWFIDLSLS